jgi:NAD(P)-dependent dehydrogenase (short-subunit alcohol dehydrogenase family)
MNALQGKTAVVTGGTSGIGLETARLFAAEGAKVFVTGRQKETLDAAVEQLGGDVTGVQADVSDLADLDRLFETVAAQGKGLDVLFANAGGGEFATLEQVTEKHYADTFDTNVKGTMFTVQKALPHLVDGASVILSASNAGSRGNEAFGVYGASKAAVRSFARTWAKELAGRGIRVNAISPGPVDTPGIDGLVGGGEAAVQLKEVLGGSTPLGRMASPEEIAPVVLFLATDASSYVTGTELFADGGANQV